MVHSGLTALTLKIEDGADAALPAARFIDEASVYFRSCH